MAQVMTTITSRPQQLPVMVRKLRDQATLVWSEAQPKTRTAVQMGALLAVTIIAYNYSLLTLLQLADLNSPLAYVSLVPIIALILAAVNSRPSQPEPAIHDRQTDYIVGLPLMVGALCANLFLPSKLSAMFWVWRIDLLTLPFFVAGAVAVIFGVRVLWRQKVAVAFLLLAWPYPYTSVLLGLLNAFTTDSARSIRCLARWRRLMFIKRRLAMPANVVRKSAFEPTSWTSVVAHPASLARTSNSMRSTVFPTPRRPV